MSVLSTLKESRLLSDRYVLCVVVATVVSSSVVTTLSLYGFARLRGILRSKSCCCLNCDCGCSPDKQDDAVGPSENRSAARDLFLYESDSSLCQYLEFHFTPSRVSFAQSLLSIRESFDYPLRVARKFARFKPAPSSRKVKRALDIGCATGASTFVMSKHFDDVIGIDLSQTFIHFAKKVAASIVSGDPSAFKFFAPLQGETMEERCVSVPEGVIAKNCHFFCGDAMHLIEESNGGGNASPTPISFRFDDVSWYQVPRGEKFDGVLCANVLCRVPDPRKLLDTLSHLLYSGGVLVLSSPYSWEDVGNRDKWIGGRHGDPKSEDLVKQILVKDFELLSESDEAFLIRDHCRRYQLGFAHCTVWRRR